MDESLLRHVRHDLKAALINERSKRIGPKYYPVCAICDKGITTGGDLHEIIITRGDIRGNEHLRPLIHVRENCALVHPGGCHIKAATKEGQTKAIKHLIYWEGIEVIQAWLEKVGKEVTGDLAYHAELQLMEVQNAQGK